MDNHGKWSSYDFRPKLEMVETVSGTGKNQKKKKENKYVGHCLPTGCMVIPQKKVTGEGFFERKNGGWNFFYNGWKSENPTN